MVNVGMNIHEVGPVAGESKIYIVVVGGTTTERQFTVQLNMNLTDTIAILNTNIRAAVKDFLVETYPNDTNWALATYILFGGGQIIL